MLQMLYWYTITIYKYDNFFLGVILHIDTYIAEDTDNILVQQ